MLALLTLSLVLTHIIVMLTKIIKVLAAFLATLVAITPINYLFYYDRNVGYL
jgi:hypothetical protein